MYKEANRSGLVFLSEDTILIPVSSKRGSRPMGTPQMDSDCGRVQDSIESKLESLSLRIIHPEKTWMFWDLELLHCGIESINNALSGYGHLYRARARPK